jgi:hypothetical protein
MIGRVSAPVQWGGVASRLRGRRGLTWLAELR